MQYNANSTQRRLQDSPQYCWRSHPSHVLHCDLLQPRTLTFDLSAIAAEGYLSLQGVGWGNWMKFDGHLQFDYSVDDFPTGTMKQNERGFINLKE